jgi:hypothetical protein
MRPPRPRLTMGWLIVAVTTVVMMLALPTVLEYREERFRDMISRHSSEELLIDLDLDLGGLSPRVESSLRERARYHKAMREKYVYALRHPWLPLGADPPEPR